MVYPALTGDSGLQSGTGSEPISQAADAVPTRGSPRAVYVSVAGTVVGRLQDDSVDSTWANVPVGPLSLVFKKINSTANGTSATVTQFIY